MLAGGAFAADSGGYTGQARTFLWNPGFNDVVDTSQYRKEAPFVIGFSNAGVADGWLVTFKHGVEWAAAQNRDRIGKFLITDANWDADKQIRDIQDLLNQDIDLLLVNPVTRQRESWTPSATTSTRAGSRESCPSPTGRWSRWRGRWRARHGC